VIDAITLLMRDQGFFDAKQTLSKDVSVLGRLVDRVLAKREEEAAERAAELAEREAAEAAEAEGEAEAAPAAVPSFTYTAPAAKPAPVAAKVTGKAANVLDAIKRSPLMLELDSSVKGLNEIAGMVRFVVMHAVIGMCAVQGCSFDVHTLTLSSCHLHQPSYKHSPTTS
jgi:hypothetical protein